MNVEYLGGSFTVGEAYPESGLPEVAIMGRSNVGKSSLINMLLEHRQLARVSKTPGRTQALHFFAVRAGAPEEICLVDLPGYGYAQAPLEVKRTWPALVYSYLDKRPELKLGLLLVDIRREIRDEEKALAERFAARSIPLILVATKADKEAKTRRTAAAEKLGRSLNPPAISAFALSAISREGREALWEAIAKVAAPRRHR